MVRKYGLRLSDRALELLAQETPKTLTNVETHITGSVRQLCASAEQTARALGYTPVILTASLRCTARDAGSFLASICLLYTSRSRTSRSPSSPSPGSRTPPPSSQPPTHKPTPAPRRKKQRGARRFRQRKRPQSAGGNAGLPACNPHVVYF